MTNYTKTTDFAAKDALPSGNSAKIVKGSEIDTEFNNIATASATKANKNNAALTGTTTFETISDGTIAITAFVDEDNMASDSATLLPTQQSVKAYVDSQVTAQDLDFQADTGGALSIDLDSETLTFTGGTGVDTSGSGNAVTFAIDSTVATLTGSQTLSNKTLSAPVVSGNLTTDGLLDGRDVAADGTKLDGIEALADVTDTANVTAAGALMDSELTNITAVKALNQGVATTDSPTFAGLTTTADVSFGDNDKAIFGAGSDLEIYHDASHSFIKDSGTGHLKIQATNLKLQDVDGNNYIDCIDGSYVRLMHNTATKLETTATGIDVTGVITTDGMTTSADINFGDNDKAVFGAGSDLQIYHDGAKSIISDSGTGPLAIQGQNTIVLEETDGTNYATFTKDGAVTLYYAGADKLATTSTGIDVTGSVVSDGLTVDGGVTTSVNLGSTAAGSSSNVFINKGFDSAGKLDFASGGTPFSAFRINVDSQEAVSFDWNYDNAVGVDRDIKFTADGSRNLLNLNSNGDISFYEDTGTTPKLFWDSSAESLGIGTTSPSVAVHASGKIRAQKSGQASAYVQLSADELTSNYASDIFLNDTGLTFKHNSDSRGFVFDQNGTERMRIDSAGNVGIGTSSPATRLDVASTGEVVSTVRTTSTSGARQATLRLNVPSTGGDDPAGRVQFTYGTGYTVAGSIEMSHTNNNMKFLTGTTERMRIDSSGNVGAGVTSPSSYYAKDLVVGAADEGGITIAGGTNDQNYLMFADGTSGSSQYKGYIGYDHPTDMMQMVTHGALRFYNGTSSSEMGRFDANGNLLVGTTSGTGKLEVYEAGNLTEANPHFRIHGAGYSGYHFLDGTAYYIGQSSTVRALRLYSGAETAGVALTNGSTSWGTFSDERLKYDVEPIENALESLSDLRTVKYRLRDVDEPDSQKKIGVVAQDLVGVLDEVIDPLQITGDDTEYMAVRYTELVPVLIKAIQEQQATITALEARITQLENN